MKEIGRKDKIWVSELEVYKTCKIDTGAYKSSIEYTKLEIKDEILIVTIDNKKLKFSEYYYSNVKNTSGSIENRYTVKLKIRVFNKPYKVDFTLNKNRKHMKHPILIGRKFLQKKFIINLNKINLSYKYENSNII